MRRRIFSGRNDSRRKKKKNTEPNCGPRSDSKVFFIEIYTGKIFKNLSSNIIKLLKDRQAKVKAYDPYVEKDSTAKSVDDILNFADVIILITDHKEFKDISPADLKKKGIVAVIDGRNVWDKDKIIELGIIYKGIGR